MPQVFISYSRKDSAFIDQLVADLRSAGLTVWYDLSGLDGGTQWETEIQGAIEQSQYFLAVLSPGALESKWVVREFLYAEKRGIKIIPVLFLPCELPMRMLDLQLIDLQKDNYSQNFDRLLKALNVPTRAEAQAKILAEQQTLAASLAKKRSEAEQKEQLARLEKEKRERDEEEQRKRNERMLSEAREKAQKAARLDKERQEKAESRLRSQAEKEERRAEARLRQRTAWQTWKPRLPRLAALGLLVVLLIAAAVWVPELIQNGGANLPAATSPAASLITNQPVTTSPQASTTHTIEPTKTPLSPPSATPIPTWIANFAEPVLNAISGQDPFFEDDFSTINQNWSTQVYNPGVDCSNSSSAISNGSLQLLSDPGCFAMADLSSIVNLHNFVIQVDAELLQTDPGYFAEIHIGKYDNFKLFSDGGWEIVDCGSRSDCVTFRTGNTTLDQNRPVKVTMISFETRNAIYLNSAPLYYFEHPVPDLFNHLRLDGGGISINGTVNFDNLKIHDLDAIPDLASLLK